MSRQPRACSACTGARCSASWPSGRARNATRPVDRRGTFPAQASASAAGTACPLLNRGSIAPARADAVSCSSGDGSTQAGCMRRNP
ncbi:hypothetical protein G6F62_015190 [Rhizopus arrhizus]|nr:hypothetical protein G6F24_018189 [Rhizopus arrhizus]KAG0771854.1 hypothetical protein G6F21_014654 [Rhizopus arrhizus]KAG1307638.1 hypothetical protein G6F62_015190 [Rhizopus arrhizus]